MRLGELARRALGRTRLPEIVIRRRARKSLTVLGYHRISPRVAADYPFNEELISASPEEFTRELRFLRDQLDVISMSDLIRGLREPSLLPERAALITFDDGYFDNEHYALPLLKEVGLPACFFICTGLVGARVVPWYEAYVCCLKRSRARRIDSPFGPKDPPYDLTEAERPASIRRFRYHIRRMPWAEVPRCLARLSEATSVEPLDFLCEPLFMSWDAVRNLDSCGMEIGGHTRTHPILSRIEDAGVLRNEIGGCYEDIVRMLGRPPQAFAYPWGHAEAMSGRADGEIRRAGFGISFSFVHGYAPRHAGRLVRLPRIHSDHGEDFRSFRVGVALAPDLTRSTPVRI